MKRSIAESAVAGSHALLAMSVCAIFAAGSMGAAFADEHEHEHGHEEGAPQYHGASGPYPFSDAVQVGQLLFLSGKIGNKPGTAELAPGGIQGETRQTLENIKAAVERYGSSMHRVVKCTVFLADMAEWGAMNEVYATYFPENRPARSAMGVNGLALDARVEIECIAALDH